MRDLFLRALKGSATERPPVWLMRQAGRYMPDYQLLRSKYTLCEMFHEPELAAEVTMLPIHLLNVDAAILFSDILVIAEAFGRQVVFPESGGPYVTPHVTTLTDIENLRATAVQERLHYVDKTLRILKPQLSVPLIGFCGGPFTVASYMIEGAGRAGFKRTLELLSAHPEAFHMMLQKITDASIEYLLMQVRAGADAVQLFDSWASKLTQEQFVQFCLPYWKQIVDALSTQNIPTIVFCRDSYRFARHIATIAPAAISIDEQGILPDIRKIVGPRVTLQGNLSAEFLRDASRDMVIKQTKELLHSMQGDPAYIANLGHGVLPSTPMENVRVFVQTVQQHGLKK